MTKPMPDQASAQSLTQQVLVNPLRTALATVFSLLLARALGLTESYWAPISTIVILLSTVNPLALAWQRFLGTALGAILGGLIATYLGSSWIVYGVGVLVCGVLCALLRLTSSYRFAAITLTIVLLVSHGRPPWVLAFHRFVEVSLGIAVGLLVTAVWPAQG